MWRWDAAAQAGTAAAATVAASEAAGALRAALVRLQQCQQEGRQYQGPVHAVRFMRHGTCGMLRRGAPSCSCSISRDTLRGMVSESTSPTRKESHLGKQTKQQGRLRWGQARFESRHKGKLVVVEGPGAGAGASLGQQLLKVLGDEDTAHVELDGGLLGVVIVVQVCGTMGCTTWCTERDDWCSGLAVRWGVQFFQSAG